MLVDDENEGVTEPTLAITVLGAAIEESSYEGSLTNPSQ